MSSPGLVLLKGGPSGAPQVVQAPSGGEGVPVKIAYVGGYEHYEFTGEFADIGEGPMPVYRWTRHQPGAE
ncbi:DUF5988 family protein [Streptomyces xantholiticus]|uniref:DUF5988 family protein n=1 Tax=Streptomyces xantholiticus TaxID=68285 RepID=UPI0019BC37BB|nr:DUF5988 family protein [Streptomyces xantholiticus]GGW49442.1 hypothetical protein GCM10010381_38490 [Streptomyces xantholiticus]